MHLPEHFAHALTLAEIALVGLEDYTNGHEHPACRELDYHAWECRNHVRMIIRLLRLKADGKPLLTYYDMTEVESQRNPRGQEAAAGLLRVACWHLWRELHKHPDWDNDECDLLSGVSVGLDAAQATLESLMQGGSYVCEDVGTRLARAVGIPYEPRKRPWREPRGEADEPRLVNA